MSESDLFRTICARLEERTRAARDHDLEAMTAQLSPDIVTFDVGAPLRNEGKDAVRRRLAQWFDGYDGPIGYDLAELQVRGEGAFAFSHCLVHVTGKLKGGDAVSMWVRSTVAWERHGDEWLAVHEHMSDPMDFETGQTLVDLNP